MKILLIPEHDNYGLHPHGRRLLGAAQCLGVADIDVLVIGEACAAVAEEAALWPGLARVRLVQAPHYATFLAEELAMIVAQMAGAYSHVLLPASAFGKNLAPRVAAMLDVSPVTDVTAILGPQRFERPACAGNVIETLTSAQALQVLTVRPSAFEAVAGLAAQRAPVEHAAPGPAMGVSERLSLLASARQGPQLETARVVVAGGRGLGSREAFHALLGPLAECLGAALGGTRVAVDADYIENDAQIGQTGKVLAPDLYIGVGLSGAVQHLAGIRAARQVVAINTDPEAPIMQMADLALVGDVHEVLPRLTSALQALRAQKPEAGRENQ